MRHPMTQYQDSQQMGSFFSDIWEDFRTENIDPLVESTLTSVGVDQKEIDRIKAEAGNAFNQELQDKQKDLVNQIIGGGGSAPKTGISTADATIQNLREQLRLINQNKYLKQVPGGLITVVVAPIALFALYSIVKSDPAPVGV